LVVFRGIHLQFVLLFQDFGSAKCIWPSWSRNQVSSDGHCSPDISEITCFSIFCPARKSWFTLKQVSSLRWLWFW
jgi:hypothetical protein